MKHGIIFRLLEEFKQKSAYYRYKKKFIHPLLGERGRGEGQSPSALSSLNAINEFALSSCFILMFLAFALTLPLLSGCSRHKPVRATPPYETLLMVLADYRRHAETDLYRFGVPKDISGQNVFRATLDRLDYFEQTNAGTDTDVVNFTRGESYFRLGDYKRAFEAFSRVTATADSPLSPKASERIELVKQFQKAVESSAEVNQLGEYVKDLVGQQERLTQLGKELQGKYEASLARRELEQTETDYAIALFRNRYVLDQGAPRSLEFLKSMIERHGSSRRLYAHRLMLGRFYFELARDLATLTPPDRLGFDTALFYNLINSAQQQVALVSQADGYPEKLEAAPLLREIEAFARNVRTQADIVLNEGAQQGK